jgi:hypothetical protein
MRDHPAGASLAVGAHDVDDGGMGNLLPDPGVGTVDALGVEGFVVKGFPIEKIEKGGAHFP